MKNLITAVLFFLLIVSCKKTDWVLTCNYIYINQSGYDITLKVYNLSKELIHEYQIQKNETLNIELKGEGGVPPFHYGDNGNEYGDSLVVLFDTSRILTCIKKDFLFNENNYVEVEKKKRTFDLTYTFTIEDYNRADSLK